MKAVCVKEYFRNVVSSSNFALCSTHVGFSKGNDVLLHNFNPSCGKELVSEAVKSLMLSPLALSKFEYVYLLEILLSGHHAAITALKFSNLIRGSYILVSSASDYLIAWNIDEVTTCFENAEVVRGHVLCSLQESPNYLSFSQEFELICAISQTCFIICDSILKKVVMKHEVKDLSSGEFISSEELVTSTFDGCITFWNVPTGNVLQKINSTYSYSLTSLTTNPSFRKICVGSSVATIQEYAFCDKLKRFKELVKIDLDESLMRIFPSWKQDGDASRGHVIAMSYFTRNCDNQNSPNSNVEEDHYIVCATERAIFIFNHKNQEVQVCSYLDDKVGPPVVSQAQFIYDFTKDELYCIALCMFDSKFLVYSITLPESNHRNSIISMISNDPLTESSPLRSQVKLTKPSKPKNDQFIAFKSKVQSSGYTASPRMTMFKPVTSLKKKSTVKSRPIKPTPASHASQNEPDWSADVDVYQALSLSAKGTCINNIVIDDGNRYLACSLGDTTVQVSKLPLPSSSSSKFKVISGHDKPVTGCFWSHDKDLLLTSSRDGKVKVWPPPFTEDETLSFQVSSSGKITKDLVHAQFYYLDKFIIAGMGNSLHMYKYFLHEGPKDPIKRYLSQSKHKLVEAWPMSSAQNITCLTALNNIYSYLVLMCGSDRSIEVQDMNSGKLIHQFLDAHTRPTHTIKCCKQTSHVTSGSYDVFLTSAASDGVKLWDLRTQRCVRKLNNHSCVSKCDATMSSCGKYIATATDDKTVCIYDVRKDFPLHLVPTKERVTSLTFTADSAQIIAGLNTSSKLITIQDKRPRCDSSCK